MKAGLSAPRLSARSGRAALILCTDSRKIIVRASFLRLAIFACLAADLAGRKPSKTKRSEGRPATDRAAMIDEGPGTGETGILASWADATSRYPGSLTSGVPASLTRAMESPAESLWINPGTCSSSL